MTSVSNVSIGAKLAGAAAADARHGMNEAIARLSTGKRSMYGGDAAGQAMANSIKAKGMSYAVAARNAEDGISVATSGEYRNPGHIWGEGPKDAISVTVIDKNTTNADAWATAMYILGVEKGLEIAEKEGLAVFFIKKDGKSINSSEWSKIYP